MMIPHMTQGIYLIIGMLLINKKMKGKGKESKRVLTQI